MLVLFTDERRAHKTAMIHQMEVYLGMKRSCRRKSILAHFGEDYEPPAAGVVDRLCCDNCCSVQISAVDGRKEDEEVDFSEDARLLLQSVGECGGHFGLGVPVSVLKAASDPKRPHLAKNASWGKGKHAPKEYWMALGRSLVVAQYLGQTVVSNGGFGGGPRSFSRSFQTVQLSLKGSQFVQDSNQTYKLGKKDL